MSRAILLGPLSSTQPLADAIDSLHVEGPVALVTAGWEEAERNDADLDRALGGGSRNLGLYGRLLDVLETSSAYAEADQRYRAERAELQALYRLRITYAIQAVQAVRRRHAAARRTAGAVLDESIRAVKDLDEAHAAETAELRAAFDAAHPAEEHDVVLAHRAAVAEILSECGAVVVAGGHVGVIRDCLHLCDVGAALQGRPIIAFSSGALALSDRVLIVDDHDIAQRPAELFGPGLAATKGVVPLPDASRRVRLDDADALALLARRLAPRACVLLDGGDRLECNDAGDPDLRAARVIAPDGSVRTPAEAA